MKKVRARIIGILILLIEKFTSYRFLSKNYNLCLSNSPLVIDIGSNRGQFIDMILDIRKKATSLSFEANPKFENHLRDKYANKPNIKTFNCAVSSVNEQKEFLKIKYIGKI
jgi:phospholipid N-methyltransferase